VEPLGEIEELVAHRARGPGTDSERRAARHLEERLRDLGRDARLAPVEVRPGHALAHLIHAVAAIFGSVLAVSSPLAGAIVLGVTAVSAFGDLTGSFYLVRRLTGRRASQNVISREDGGRPGTLVLVAHYDAARTGAVFGPRVTERRAVLGRLIRRPIGPAEPFFWSIVVALACAVLRVVGIHFTALTVVQFVATVVLIVSVPLLADIALSSPVPGANDNASGVATVLRLADRYGGDLDHFDVWVLFTGAAEGLQLGMRAWLRAHRRELDKARTAFVCVDEVGHGTVRYARKEGFVIALRHHRALVELCDQIAEEDADDDGRYAARGYVSRSAGDGHVARVAGFPAVTVSCLNALDYAPHHHRPTDTVDNIDPDALERAFGFCSELIELIDERVGPDLDPA
jgi:Peptidase family M28